MDPVARFTSGPSRFAFFALTAALFVACTERTQLRVRVRQLEFREGGISLYATTYAGDPGIVLRHNFVSPARLTADLVFRFETRPRWSFLVALWGDFEPRERRFEECIYQCGYYANLTPGRSYLIELPILILPHRCPPTGDRSLADEVCTLANGLVRIPNCTFIVTSDRRCSFVCHGEPPADPDPNAPADQSGSSSMEDRGFDNRQPTPLDAGMPVDALEGIDTPPVMDVPPASDRVVYDDVTPPPDLGEPPM